MQNRNNNWFVDSKLTIAECMGASIGTSTVGNVLMERRGEKG